jgi:crotonyl-CoA reductase
VGVAKVGGKIVTCGSTSGYEHVYDNRYLWQTVKSIIGSHGAQIHGGHGHHPARLQGQHPRCCQRSIPSPMPRKPCTSCTTEATWEKSVCCASPPQEGLGIRDRELREQVGEERINVFRETPLTVAAKRHRRNAAA